MSESLRIYDRAVAYISGGASGIGRALGEALARRGATVVLADRQLELAEEVAQSIRRSGGQAEATELDVTDFAAHERSVQDATAKYGRLDYIFNNAGIGIGGPVSKYQIDDWNRVLDVNLRGVIHGVQAAYPIMLEQGFGHIVNTASMAGLIPTPGVVSYGMTKHAVVGLTTSLRIEGEPYGVRVSALCPGVIRTAILKDGGKYGKSLDPEQSEVQRKAFERYRPMDVNLFAEKALKAIARNEALIVIPSRWKMFWWLNRLSPRLGLYLSKKNFASLPITNAKAVREPVAAGR